MFALNVTLLNANVISHVSRLSAFIRQRLFMWSDIKLITQPVPKAKIRNSKIIRLNTVTKTKSKAYQEDYTIKVFKLNKKTASNPCSIDFGIEIHSRWYFRFRRFNQYSAWYRVHRLSQSKLSDYLNYIARMNMAGMFGRSWI